MVDMRILNWWCCRSIFGDGEIYKRIDQTIETEETSNHTHHFNRWNELKIHILLEEIDAGDTKMIYYVCEWRSVSRIAADYRATVSPNRIWQKTRSQTRQNVSNVQYSFEFGYFSVAHTNKHTHRRNDSHWIVYGTCVDNSTAMSDREEQHIRCSQFKAPLLGGADNWPKVMQRMFQRNN